ncbi:uncharacterized protein LOC9633039 isoform X1 [Selaginella moellendorffii]|uniref:uncharacterized protein LOC9633039 isoform X1 n=1 Tax=Selaginella moellendorffii TaxID=88036 RepID=UPI000D1C526A|nr:uncharacterized protein LOC9633039 isoform X1 [Selaginella moellendorffii]|eukprot:XP_024529621.1 uncharacterized protein LOC9633039 isoform X1 [Selaginella moellendorffii]
MAMLVRWSLKSRQDSGEDAAMDDVAIIREILTVTHVSVVAQLQWRNCKVFCDRLTAHTARLEKAEELAKNFQAFKEGIYEVCKNTAKECKDFTEVEVQKQAEKLDTHVKVTGDRINAVQKGNASYLVSGT